MTAAVVLVRLADGSEHDVTEHARMLLESVDWAKDARGGEFLDEEDEAAWYRIAALLRFAAVDACGLCGKHPAAGYALVGEVRYCHGDVVEATCYMQASASPRVITGRWVVK